MSILDGLNEKQLEAVSETEGYVRVIAGAGSGKTKLLVCRYAYLVQEYGIDASNILCVTFTNKAAGEMKRRIQALVGEANESSLVCTYHGFCARLLREDAEKLFLPKSFQILDGTQQKTILGEIYQKHELKLDYASFERILKVIGQYKSDRYSDYVPRICSPDAVGILPEHTTMDDILTEEYMQRQKAIGALDFHDLISFALYLLETNDAVRQKWQEQLNYIQVDEFQDSSCREMKLIDLLAGGYGNLMIVGDPDQNIYEWRGSDVKLLVDFDQTHHPTKTIFLNRNYRSTPQILECANTLIDKNTLRLKKDLFTTAPPGADVVHYHSRSEDEETDRIAEIIQKGVRGGRPYADFAVLYRSGFLSRVVENRLVEQNIPYEIYGGVKFYQRMEILDVVAYLRLIAFNDDLSLKRILNKPRRRFGRSKMAALEQLQGTDGSPPYGDPPPHLFEALAAHVEESPFKNSDAGEFVRWITEMRAAAEKLRITDIVNRVTTESGYEKYIRELGDEERYENLMEFKRIADEFERNFGESLTLPEFLQQISLQAGEETEQTRDAVKLMTIHAAKGLEFPVVFVMGLSEGVFPSSKTIEERKQLGLEEERRLCYVAITRAEEQLYLMDSEGLSPHGMKKLPSRFLREIGEQHYVRIGTISKSLETESRAYSKKLDSAFAQEDGLQDFRDGKTVRHHIFGTGKILSADPARRTVKVQFEGMKTPRSLSVDYFRKEHTEAPLLQRRLAQAMEAGEAVAEPTMTEEAFAQMDEVPEEPAPVPGAAEVVSAEDEERDTAGLEKPPEDEIVAEEQEEAFEEEELVLTDEFGEETTADQSKIDPELLARLHASDNLWKREDVPHSGWRCTGITDLGSPCGICEMCGNQIIRYAHHMAHPHFRPLVAGCICAGKMEGDVDAAKQRERDLKNRTARKESFLRRKWKRSRNGNYYRKVQGHLLVLYRLRNGTWKYAVDSTFSPGTYTRQENAALAASDSLEKNNA